MCSVDKEGSQRVAEADAVHSTWQAAQTHIATSMMTNQATGINTEGGDKPGDVHLHPRAVSVVFVH